MRYIGLVLLFIFLLNPCFAQEGYVGHYVNALSGIKARKGFVYQNAGGAFVVLSGNGLYALPTEIETEKQKIILAHPQMEVSFKESQISWGSGNSFPESTREIGIVLNGGYLEHNKVLEASKGLKKRGMGEASQYVIGREGGFKIADAHKAGFLNVYLEMNNNLSMIMLAGPHGGGGGAYDMVMAVGPHGGGGGAYMKAYQWKQGEISKENLEQWMQTAGIAPQISLHVINGFGSSLKIGQLAGISELPAIQIGVSSMHEFSEEELLGVIMEAQKNIQQYYEDNNVVWKNYYQGKDMGYIDSDQLEAIANSAVSL